MIKIGSRHGDHNRPLPGRWFTASTKSTAQLHKKGRSGERPLKLSLEISAVS